MKKILLMASAIVTLSQSTAFAIQVMNAKLDRSEQNILVDVRHGGGCGEHDYSLKIVSCLESMPVQCIAKLIHKTNDFCEAILRRTATLNLAASGLNEDYYSGASLTIVGSDNSEVEVQLPETKKTSSNQTTCTTHTGSQLVISPDSVTLQTVAGTNSIYQVENIDVVSFESYPPIEQKTYLLEDGRSIVTSFRGDERSGSGYFIRLNGEYSPEFNCKK